MTKKAPEVGYNYLNTAYSGASSSKFTGNEHFPFVQEDMGVAATLASMELTSPLCGKKKP